MGGGTLRLGAIDDVGGLHLLHHLLAVDSLGRLGPRTGPWTPHEPLPNLVPSSNLAQTCNKHRFGSVVQHFLWLP